MYSVNYFRERGDYELTPYLKTFKKIYCHNDKVYPLTGTEIQENTDEYIEPKGYILSNSRIPNTIEEEVLSNTEECMDYQWNDLSSINPLPQAKEGQLTSYNDSIRLPVRVKFAGTVIIQYEPMTRTFIIPDIFHKINDFTETVVETMKQLERQISIEQTIQEPWKKERHDNYALIGGNVYKMQEVQNGVLNFEKQKKRHEKALEELMQKLDNVGEGGISIPSSTAYRLIGEQIGSYITSNGEILFTKQIELKVDKVIRGDIDQMTTKIPDEFVESTSGVIVIKCKNINNQKEFYPLTMTGFGTDMTHPHRFNSQHYGGDIHNMCVGSVRNGELECTDDVIGKFEEINKAMEVINISSIASTQEVNNGANDSFYRLVHKITNPEQYNGTNIERHIRDYGRNEEEKELMLEYLEEQQ